jgi:hypothetical protein
MRLISVKALGAPIVCAGPTVGKSRLMTKLALRAVTVIDTDEVTHELWPEWFTERTFASAAADVRMAHDRRVGDATASAYLRASTLNPGRVVVFTNMWGPFFRAALRDAGILTGETLPIGIFRSSPAEISAISHKRGIGVGEIATSLAASWVESWTRLGPTAFDTVLWIPRADTGRPTYLSDLLDFEGFGFDLLAGVRR